MKKKTLKDLIGRWEMEVPKEGYSSSIQLRSYRLFHLPIVDFSDDDIRFMIIQGFGIDYLVPIAMERLSGDLLLETCYYEGDLLKAVLTIPYKYWELNTDRQKEMAQLLNTNQQRIKSLNPTYNADRELIAACESFLSNYKFSI
jgi:hypothetical protein